MKKYIHHYLKSSILGQTNIIKILVDGDFGPFKLIQYRVF